MNLLTSEVDKLNITLRTRADEYRGAEDRLRSLQLELDDYRGKYTKLELQIKQQMSNDMNRVVQENEELKRRFSILSQENEGMRVEINGLREKLSVIG